jgi:hypothetical protein
MKLLILVSIFCLTLCAQAPQTIHPPYITPATIGVWSVVQGIQNSHQRQESLVPRELKVANGMHLLKDPTAFSGVCSVLLLEAHADANDPGIATTPRDNSVPIPQAHLPAPSCKRQ